MAMRGEDRPAARKLIIEGRVQGVCYRDWAVEKARMLGITGWVRNLSSGEVEAHIEGIPDKLEAFSEDCWRGPPAANVQRVAIWLDSPEPCETFDRRATC